MLWSVHVGMWVSAFRYVKEEEGLKEGERMKRERERKQKSGKEGGVEQE